jgi:hypothetical protein
MKSIAVVAAAGLIGSLAMASSASAFSVINQDAQPHVLKVLEGDNAREVRLEANQQADNLCTSLCNVTLDDSDEAYEVAANERLLISEGMLMVADEPMDDQAFGEGEPGVEQYVEEEVPADPPINADTE